MCKAELTRPSGTTGVSFDGSARRPGYLQLVRTDHMQVRAEGWNHYIERQIVQRWAPVCRAWFPDRSDVSLDWTWKFLQYVFQLDDPRDFPVLAGATWSERERRVLDRYVSHARDLADANVLTARNGYKVHLATLDSEPEITETMSRRDVTVGFLTMFRQCYAPDEEASFARAHDLVAREVHRVGGETEIRKAWRRAHATLRHTHLDHLVLVRAVADKWVPEHLAERNASHPSQTDSPEQMIATLFYGDATGATDERRLKPGTRSTR
jgi:hypothetical protein